MSSQSEQLLSIADKYQNLYAALERFAAGVLSDASLPRLTKYGQLKIYLTGLWDYVFSPEARSRPFSWEELPGHCLAQMALPMDWSENGVPKTGSRSQFMLALDKLWVDVAKDYLDPNCELVMDLGCGWGHRMFDMWNTGRAPRAKYRGGDRSEGSRNLVKQLAGLFPEMDVDWFRFDFLKPDFDSIPGQPKKVFLYTSAAIEQVKYLGPAFFDRLIARFQGAEIVGAHIEPITFQFAEDYPPPSHVDIERDLRAAKLRSYNFDLYTQVKNHPRLKILDVKQALIDTGKGNSFSLLAWRTA